MVSRRRERGPADLDRPRRVVVTGSGGISLATTQLLLDRGDHVHVISLSPEVVAEFGGHRGELTLSVADLSDDNQTAAAFDEACAAMGELDGLVAVAGGSGRALGDGPIEQLTQPALHRNVDLNLATTANSLREFLIRDHTGDHRSAVLIGSALARYPASPLFVTHAYAALKAGIEGLGRATAAHYASRATTINVVAPGLVRTPMSQRAQDDPEVSDYARRRQPLAEGGFIDPLDVAEACEWLLGARTVTGQVIYVDAGWSVYG